MSSVKQSKINKLLQSTPPGVVMLSSWLKNQGYSFDLQKRYRKSGWLESVGSGAMIRAGDGVGYEGGLYALQAQAGSFVHVGGRSALSLLGRAHYLELAQSRVILFGGSGENLPVWFRDHDWGMEISYCATSFLPPDMGLTDVEFKTFSIKVSAAPRALMECLYLAPDNQDLVECYELMEGLNNLRPNQVQTLLEACTSVKVKRLFMVLAEKAGHSWVSYLDLGKVDFGRGKRSVVNNGAYVEKYQITVPRELFDRPFNYLMNNRRRILEVFKGKDEKLLNTEIPFLLKAWIQRDGAVSVEISEFFSQLLLYNPDYIMRMFSKRSVEFDSWLDSLEHSMFTNFGNETPEQLTLLKEKISASLRAYINIDRPSLHNKMMAERILGILEGISIRVIE